MRGNDVMASHDSDFVIGKYTFEIGGKKKGRKQIADIPNGIVVRDDIEYGAEKNHTTMAIRSELLTAHQSHSSS